MGTLPSRSHRLLGYAGARAAVVVAACGALQCTYDFDHFDPAAAVVEAQGGAAGQNTLPSDASAGGPMADESASSVDSGTTGAPDAPIADAPSTPDAAAAPEASSDGGCGAECISMTKICAATCTTAYDTCLAPCTRANCKTSCMTTRATCLLSCVSTCQTCTRADACQQNAMCSAAAQ